MCSVPSIRVFFRPVASQAYSTSGALPGSHNRGGVLPSQQPGWIRPVFRDYEPHTGAHFDFPTRPPFIRGGRDPTPACEPTRLDWQPGEPSPFRIRVLGSSIVLILSNLGGLILTPPIRCYNIKVYPQST